MACTTTDLIELLKRLEKGGVTGKPRVISLTVNGVYIHEPKIELESTGDGIAGPQISLFVEGKPTTDFSFEPKPAHEGKMIKEKPWDEFRENGLLWFINTILHMFGWAIVLEKDDKSEMITDAYPARVKFRGFDSKSNSEGYIRVSEFMANYAQELFEEAQE